MTTSSLTLDEIYALAHEALLNAGANAEHADAVADVVTRAERDGSHSHGLFRIPGYVASLRSGKVKGDADPTLSKRSPVVLHCDGDLGYAPLAHRRSLTALAEAAKENGLATLSLTRTHHFAALWPETETLGQHGLVAMACVSYMPSVAPYGASQALYGTNPFSFAWPRAGGTPLVFDMATASMAMGDVQIAARDGHEVPAGTGLNADGAPTTDPKEIIKGVLLPFGGYKGSHIAMMIELLAGPLVGETASYASKSRDSGDGGPPQGGEFILAMNPDMLSGADWQAESEAFLAKLDALEGVRLPAERRYANRQNTGPREINAELLAKIRATLSPG
ncbi:MAG: Ldh family oxidoreductase [Arenicellales bacterium]